MADDKIIVKSNEKPSYFTEETAIGFLIAPIMGSIAGAIIGHNRMEREQELGKVVSKKPSFWNKDLLLGGLIGSTLVGLAIVAAVIIAPEALVAMTVGLSAAAIKFGMMAATLMGGLVGGYIGGEMGQDAEIDEYKKAASLHPEVVKQHGYEMNISKDHAAYVERERERAKTQEKTR